MNKTSKEIQINYLLRFHEKTELQDKTDEDIQNLYIRHSLIDMLKEKKNVRQNRVSRISDLPGPKPSKNKSNKTEAHKKEEPEDWSLENWPLDKLENECKKSTYFDQKDLCYSILINLLKKTHI